MESLVQSHAETVLADRRDVAPLVHYDRVTKEYGGFTAIKELSLEIFKGEFFALLGPSGSGKTTLMRMLAGFESVTGGRITIDGTDISHTPAHHRPVNMMFQSYALFPHMTVSQNIAFGLKQEKTPKAEIKRRVEEVLSLVQLDSLARRKPDQLSGGQRQRVALARSIIKRPQIILLDEPLAALDKKLRNETQLELMSIQETLGLTFIIVTHDQEEAMTVANRIAIMDHGRLVQVDTPSNIYEFPNSRYVAEFIGEANFFEGNVTCCHDGMVNLSWAEGQPELVVKSSVDLAPGATAQLILRPEKFEMHHEKPPTRDNVLCGNVVDVAYTGAISSYHVKLANGMVVSALRANQGHVAKPQFQQHDTVWLSWAENAGVLLGDN